MNVIDVSGLEKLSAAGLGRPPLSTSMPQHGLMSQKAWHVTVHSPKLSSKFHHRHQDLWGEIGDGVIAGDGVIGEAVGPDGLSVGDTEGAGEGLCVGAFGASGNIEGTIWSQVSYCANG